MTDQVGLITAFTAGFLSFVSPCVLPLVPAYISYISGVSLEALKGAESEKGASSKVIINTLLFILGFTVVFSTLGATASLIGQYLVLYKNYINIIGGALIIILGLHLTGIFRIKLLEYEKRIHVKEKPLGLIGSFLIGAAFAFGWTPCIGPILSAILLIAADQKTIIDGVFLLVIYSMGLGIPFLITGIALNYALSVFKTIKKNYRKIELASGLLLICIGVLVATDQFTRLSAWLARFDSLGG
jgi:cytochrome c-type biogenesis protein